MEEEESTALELIDFGFSDRGAYEDRRRTTEGVLSLLQHGAIEEDV